MGLKGRADYILQVLMLFTLFSLRPAEVICPNTPGQELPGLNSLMSNSTEGYVFRVGDIVSCQCKFGYIAGNIGCMAACSESGSWEPHDFGDNGASIYTCVPVICNKRPAGLVLGSYSPTKPYGSVWQVGEKVVYHCQTNLRLTADDGNVTAECVSMGDNTSRGKWNYPNKHPECVPEDRMCGDHPQVENAQLIHDNGTELNAYAVYECVPGHRLVGDGIIRCMKSERYVSMFSAVFSVAKWMYEPKCVAICQPPEAEAGDVGKVVFTMTTCVFESNHKKDALTCEQPVVFEIIKTKTAEIQRLPGISVMFGGKYLCVAKEAVKEKYEVVSRSHIHAGGSPVTECRSQCLSACDGFTELTVEEAYRYRISHFRPVEMKKTIYKLQTRC